MRGSYQFCACLSIIMYASQTSAWHSFNLYLIHLVAICIFVPQRHSLSGRGVQFEFDSTAARSNSRKLVNTKYVCIKPNGFNWRCCTRQLTKLKNNTQWRSVVVSLSNSVVCLFVFGMDNEVRSRDSGSAFDRFVP